MPIPFLIPLLAAAGGAGLGALKGATDGKKGNLLSSMLIGGGLGAAGGMAAPMLGLGGAGAGAAASQAGTAATAATAAGGAGKMAGLKSLLSKSAPFMKNMAMQRMAMQQQPQQDANYYPPMNPAAPVPIAQLNDPYYGGELGSQLRPIQVQRSY